MSTTPQLINILWILICAALVMLMQGGFCFLESGLARAKNSINVAMKNLVDFCVAMIVFWTFGFAIMFGASHSGLFGTSHFFVGQDAGPWLLSFFLFQVVFCGTATTIISGAVAERMRFRAYLVISVVVSGLIYPVFGHWAWGGAINGETTGWLNSQGFIDFAGSSVVHCVGGWVALAATIIVGPRLGRFGKHARPINGHNLPMATFGVLLLWFGWFGFNGGSTLALNENVPLILVNTNLAAAFGGLMALLISWSIERRPIVTQVMNGVVAGLVAITASCHIMTPLAAVAIGAIGGSLCCLVTYLLPRLKIDDVIGAIPAHAVAGTWGTLAVALLASPDAWGTGLTRWQQFMIQTKGVAVCFAWSFGVGLIVLWTLNRLLRFRVSEEHERSGLNIAEHGASTELVDLMTEMQSHQEQGEFSRQVSVEPHTEVGQIAAEYNRVLERVDNEMRSRESAERKFRGIFENSMEGIFQTTLDGKYISANPALAQIYGYESPEEMIDAFNDIGSELYVEPGRRDEFINVIEDEGIVTCFESRVKRCDGELIWISENARAIRGEDGKLLHYEGSVKDITHRKETEGLHRQMEAAKAANKAKSSFLANMSHEIRTPLNGVIGMLDLMAGTELNSTQVRYVGVARSSADALLSLINDILDFSKIEAGKLELEDTEFNLHLMLEDVPDMFLHRAGQKGLELSCHVLQGVPQIVRGDCERLRQILVNLVGNALKFTDFGEIAIRAELDDSSKPARVRFSVRDTGIGIPADRMHLLFGSFSQVDASTTRKFGGTGLGLTICKQLVELMGGEIGVESTLGEGSVFWCSVPLTVVIVDGDQVDDVPERLRRTRILAVDDNETNLEILRDQLSRWGLEYSTVTSAEKALDALRIAKADGRPYGLVILDMLMPGTNGLELAMSIKADEQLNDTHMLMLTSLDHSPEEEDVQKLGLTRLQKPVRQSRLFDAIVGSLRNGKSEQPNVVQPSVDAEPWGGKEQTEQILIADDNETNQMVAREIVRSVGFESTVVSNGQEAIEALRENSFGLVLMDCEMPVMDGLEATREIRRMEENGELTASPGRNGIPIIALTAKAIRGDRERCLDAGMTDYVTKPVDRGELVGKVLASLCQPKSEPVSAESTQRHNTSQSPRDDASLNLPDLLDRCAGDRGFMARVLAKFDDRVRTDMDHLAQAVSSNDTIETARLAHALKGAAGNVSAVGVSRVASELEQLARDDNSTELEGCMSRLEEEINRTYDHIQNLLQELEAECDSELETKNENIDSRR